MKVSIAIAFLGLLLIYLEFFLPGAIMGVGGGVLLALSLVIVLSQSSTFSFIIFLILLLFALFLVIKLALRQVKASGKKNTVLLSDDQEGYQASSFDRALIGEKATAASDLKPSGHIRCKKKLYQAISKTGYIKKGTQIEIIDGKGSHFIVQTLEEEGK